MAYGLSIRWHDACGAVTLNELEPQTYVPSLLVDKVAE